MKLFYDSGNTEACKISIAAKFADVEICLVHVKPDEKVVPFLVGSRLPVLETTGDFIFSSNEACRYVWSSGKTVTEQDALTDDTWFEWEAVQLRPAVQQMVTSNGQKVTELKAVLQELNETVKERGGINGVNLVSSAIAIWCSLYPVFSESSPYKEISKEFPQIVSWFNSFGSTAEVQKGLQDILSDATWNSIASAMSRHLILTGPGTVQKKESTECKEEACLKSTITQKELDDAEDMFLNGLSKASLRRVRSGKILPQPGEKNFLITSALPYVNNVPHLGNIIGCVLSADVYARFCRLRDYNTLYICGTDEYGTATETKAIEEGITPQEICDKYHKIHDEIYKWFNISFDFFGRTTTQQQTQIAQDIFWRLYENDFILKDSVAQLLCEKCNRFLADRFVEGICPFCSADDARGDQCDKCGKLINAVELKDPKCKLCRSTPVIKSSSHLFLDLPKLEPDLNRHLGKAFETGIWTSNTKMITKSWIRDGLKPRCISRDLKWGTPVPLEGYKEKVFYVWYDAPIGYISITANYTTEWEKWWKNPEQVQLYNFMAKDNVPFHSVIFPCSLLGTREPWTVVNNLSATEYLNYEDGKFSKSRGLGVFGDNAKDTGIPADVYRFYLLYVRPESQDSCFSWDDLLLKNNSELLNNIGNFINRALMFISNNFGGCLQRITLNTEDKELLVNVRRELSTYIDNLEHIRLRDGLRNILSISTLGNQYMQASKPWVLVKGSAAERERGGSVTSLTANLCYLISVMLSPYMPEVAETIQEQLNWTNDQHVLTNQFVCSLPEGHSIGVPKPLFQKLDTNVIQQLKEKFCGKQSKTQGQAVNPDLIDNLTKEVTQQGELVRKLKAEKAEKSKIAVEVKKLLALKEQLENSKK